MAWNGLDLLADAIALRMEEVTREIETLEATVQRTPPIPAPRIRRPPSAGTASSPIPQPRTIPAPRPTPRPRTPRQPRPVSPPPMSSAAPRFIAEPRPTLASTSIPASATPPLTSGNRSTSSQIVAEPRPVHSSTPASAQPALSLPRPDHHQI
ncbi:uncharacterized protein LOC135486078 [Lineus longissimus]|uniref:uncharacterized protein LOC135486078 n=1 Tax=Lineus longissimus TaxID=88925 RepID=UPI00315C9DD3